VGRGYPGVCNERRGASEASAGRGFSYTNMRYVAFAIVALQPSSASPVGDPFAEERETEDCTEDDEDGK